MVRRYISTRQGRFQETCNVGIRLNPSLIGWGLHFGVNRFVVLLVGGRRRFPLSFSLMKEGPPLCFLVDKCQISFLYLLVVRTVSARCWEIEFFRLIDHFIHLGITLCLRHIAFTGGYQCLCHVVELIGHVLLQL
jgi:hypothetical protein